MSGFTPQPDMPGVHRYTGVHCPHCGLTMDAASPPIGEKSTTPRKAPEHGNSVLCIGCVQFSIFVVTSFSIAVRLPTTEEANYLNWLFADQILAVRRRKAQFN